MYNVGQKINTGKMQNIYQMMFQSIFDWILVKYLELSKLFANLHHHLKKQKDPLKEFERKCFKTSERNIK